MFEILVASVVPSPRSPFQVMGAVGIHAALLLAAIMATRGAALAGPAPEPGSAPAEVFINRVTPAPATAHGGSPSVALAPPVMPATVPDVGVSLQLLPTHLPTAAFDPSAYAGNPTTVPDGTIGGTEAPEGVVSLPRNDAVDQRARRIHVVQPLYPPVLRTAGIEGTVRLSFIIDTLGLVEPGSVTVLAASDPGFVASASEAVRAQRFIPAERRGVVVRALAEQTVRFALGDPGDTPQP